MSIYNNLKIADLTSTETIINHFVRKAYVEVRDSDDDYFVEFKVGNKTIHSSVITGRSGFTHPFIEYYQPYHIVIHNTRTGKKVYDYHLNLENQRVVVELGSSALGDTLAWFPYTDRFQKKHNCQLFVITFHNHLFKDQYPNITFIEPGTVLPNIFAWYRIGWDYDENNRVNHNRHPLDPRAFPMQKNASDILGLPYTELKPKLKEIASIAPATKYVCIANHSTSQAKYWNNPEGWQVVVDYLKDRGYEVILLSKEKDGHNGNRNPIGVIYPPDHRIETIMFLLKRSKFFIGIGSGLSWLSWALDVPTVLISGFSLPYTEMKDCIRISAPENKCTGCFNWIKLQDNGSWNWCPKFEGTEKQFECTKNITPTDVIDAIQPLLN
jgi:autotransporter strand-loop-strand O-heptosyltransferase